MCFKTVHVLFMFYKTKFSVYQSCQDCAPKSVEHLHMITHQNQFSLGLDRDHWLNCHHIFTSL